MERIIEYKKLKYKLENFKIEKEKIKEDEYHETWQIDNLNACIKETKRRIKRLEEQDVYKVRYSK